jgi:hypothetical protein
MVSKEEQELQATPPQKFLKTKMLTGIGSCTTSVAISGVLDA